jgi:hypothetical protein
VLTLDEEKAIEDWLREMAKIGYGRSRHQLKLTVKKIMEQDQRQNPFHDNMPGRKWVCDLV